MFTTPDPEIDLSLCRRILPSDISGGTLHLLPTFMIRVISGFFLACIVKPVTAKEAAAEPAEAEEDLDEGAVDAVTQEQQVDIQELQEKAVQPAEHQYGYMQLSVCVCG